MLMTRMNRLYGVRFTSVMGCKFSEMTNSNILAKTSMTMPKWNAKLASKCLNSVVQNEIGNICKAVLSFQLGFFTCFCSSVP